MSEVFAYKPPFGIETIKKILPHREPFLLVDEITHLDVDSVRGIKRVSPDESFFEGHFPGNPVLPGVLHIEIMAQVGACWILSRTEHLGKIAYLMTVESAKFRAPVGPGTELDVFGRISSLRSRTGRLDATIHVDGKIVSEAAIFFAFMKGAT
ncbi:MAG: hypothetical protein PWP23_239 [Candidatus Sumerlaeota bacterium]|nr:hypothetical protein [Candidatus Sumerlaeota bacterium]